MSSPLALAGVTAVLRDLLNNGLIDHNISGALGSNVTVTASPPDIIKIDEANAQTQLNLFLHQVTPNAAWRNVDHPSRDSNGTRLSNPPLALDLHYLLTAYGAADLHSEILLGYAMHLLHETPVLDRERIRVSLQGGTVSTSILPPAFQAADATDLADQVEQLRITPATLSTEEMSKLWSALQAHYRPTAAYRVSVVLIQATRATRSAPPVLTRGPRDAITGRERGVIVEPSLLPPFPTLTAIEPPDSQLAARLGDEIALVGHHLGGTNVRLRFEHRLATPIDVSPMPNPTETRVRFTLPSTAQAAIDWPAGLWSVSLSVVRPGEVDSRTTNTLAMLLAPTIDVPGSTAVRDGTTDVVTVTLHFVPQARRHQRVSLSCGGHEALAQPFNAATGSLIFTFPELENGQQWVRLRIDGADSLLVDRSQTPPGFDPSQRLTIP